MVCELIKSLNFRNFLLRIDVPALRHGLHVTSNLKEFVQSINKLLFNFSSVTQFFCSYLFNCILCYDLNNAKQMFYSQFYFYSFLIRSLIRECGNTGSTYHILRTKVSNTVSNTGYQKCYIPTDRLTYIQRTFQRLRTNFASGGICSIKYQLALR